jgi:hypothetical protein
LLLELVFAFVQLFFPGADVVEMSGTGDVLVGVHVVQRVGLLIVYIEIGHNSCYLGNKGKLVKFPAKRKRRTNCPDFPRGYDGAD